MILHCCWSFEFVLLGRFCLLNVSLSWQDHGYREYLCMRRWSLPMLKPEGDFVWTHDHCGIACVSLLMEPTGTIMQVTREGCNDALCLQFCCIILGFFVQLCSLTWIVESQTASSLLLLEWHPLITSTSHIYQFHMSNTSPLGSALSFIGASALWLHGCMSARE